MTINPLLLTRRAGFPFVAVRNPQIVWKQRQLKPDQPPEPRLYPTLDDNAWKAAIDNSINPDLRKEFEKTTHIEVSLMDNYVRHYFHIVESIYAIYAAKREIFPNAKIHRIYIGDYDSWNMPSQGQGVQKKMLDVLFPGCEVVTGTRTSSDDYRDWLCVDRSKTRTLHNKMVEPMDRLVFKYALEMREIVFKHLGITPPASPIQGGKLIRKPNILFSSRAGSKRNMTPENEKELIKLLEGIGTVDVVTFGKYAWEEQVRLSAANDIMVGVHGNNLTNFMWCPPNATCVEIFPEGSRAYDYQMQAEFFGHDYYGIDGDKIYTAFSRVGHPYGAIHEGVKGLPREQILLALHKFL